MSSLQTWANQIRKKVREHLYKQLLLSGSKQRTCVHNPNIFSPPRSSFSSSTMVKGPWEVDQGKVALLLIALFLPVTKIRRLHWTVNSSPPPFWRLSRNVPHGKNGKADLMTFRRWLQSNPGFFFSCLLFRFTAREEPSGASTT